MTRETKVGLVVACSFLCLVGIVVASKWNGGQTPTTDPEEQTVHPVAAVKPTQHEKAPDTKPKDDAKKSDKLPTFPALQPHELAKGDKPSPLVIPMPLPGETPSPVTLPPLASVPGPKPDDTAFNKLLEQKRDQAFAQNSTPPKLDPLPGPSVPSLPMPPPLGPVESKGPAALPMPPALPLDTKLPPPNPLAQDGNKKNEPLIPAPAGGVTEPFPLPVPPVVPIEEKKKDPAPATLTFPPIDKKDPPLPVPPIEKKDAPLTFPPIEKKDTPLTFPPMDKKGALDFPPIEKKDAPPLNVPLSPPGPIPSIAAKELPSTPPISTTPGVIGSTTIPQIVVGGNTGLPPVKDVKIDFYDAKPGENTFAILSLRLYGTDKYADALQAYNRAHSGMIKNGTNLNVNPPILNPGQQVMYTPPAVLERDYAALLRNQPVAQTAAPGPGKLLSAPMPLNVGVPTITPSPAVNTAPVASGRNYVVQNPAGESILDVAERALGDHRLWPRVYRLNPNYPPQARIPAGTALALPAN